MLQAGLTDGTSEDLLHNTHFQILDRHWTDNHKKYAQQVALSPKTKWKINMTELTSMKSLEKQR